MKLVRCAASAAVLIALTGSVDAYQGGTAALDAVVVASAAPGPEEASNGPAVVTLLAFLGLIAGCLLRWSSDTSCKKARSVFVAREAAAQPEAPAPARFSSISRRAGS